MGEKNTEILNKISENIANYAFDRDDIKAILENIPHDNEVNKASIDYELQILKIISVGWGLSVHMDNHPKKDILAQYYWNHIREFSKSISEMTHLTTGAEVDFFTSIKEKFDIYLKSLGKSRLKNDPASAIGPAFSEICKQPDNPYVIISGARIFNLSVNSIKEYLESETL